MKQLNFDKEYNSYKELFDDNKELYTDPDWDYLHEEIKWSTYKGTLFVDLLQLNPVFYHKTQNWLFSIKPSSNLATYNMQINTLRTMIAVERYLKIERYGVLYGKVNTTVRYQQTTTKRNQ